jgi:hypothetical protein
VFDDRVDAGGGRTLRPEDAVVPVANAAVGCGLQDPSG